MISRIKLSVMALIVSVLSFVAMASPAFAVDVTSEVCKTSDNKPVICNDVQNAQKSDPVFGSQGVVTKGVRIFLIIVGIIAVFVMLINAVKMITSDGNSDSFNKAKNGIIYAAIGLVVVLSAQGIISFLVRKV